MAYEKVNDDKIAVVLELISGRYDICHLFDGKPLK